MAKRVGKCTNYSGCKLAYRNEQIEVVTKEFRCPECGCPLEPVGKKKESSLTTTLIISVAVVLLLAIGAIVWTLMRSPARPVKLVQLSTPSPAETPTPTPTLTPELTPTPTATPAATAETSGTPINLDLTGEGLEQVKAAIIARIELQPTLSRDQKDKILEAVQAAKGLGRIAVVNFATGSASPSDNVASILLQLNLPQVKKLLDDAKIVLVVLGYADRQGDDQKNLSLSNDRAEMVAKILREKCGVVNTTYAVPMGGTDLFDSHSFARNRTVEVWAGLP
jgi:outer membrane protein OmpA-like peptidoglycan-associated protein